MSALCPSCDAEWFPTAAAVAHDDNCPRLAAMRRNDSPCRAAATGFCDCSRHDGAEVTR